MLRRLVILGVWIVACSSGGDDSGSNGFDVSKYKKTCTQPTDCVIVFSGDPCGCSCDVVAVSQPESFNVTSDRTAYVKEHCPKGPPDCGACAAPPATTCNSGKCGVE